MSLQFSNPTLKSGIVQLIDENCKSNSISYPLARKVADVNLALDSFLAIALQASGRWQFDDSNQGDYPIITTDLVAGTRDYAFLEDESGNLILDIYKVVVKATTTGQYYEVDPVDVQSDSYMNGFFSGQDIQGLPNRYDKTANAIFLDPIPSQNVTDGLKVYINREGVYFTATDTDKKPGVPGILHDYFVYRPAYLYAVRNSLKNKDDLEKEMLKCEAKIVEYFGLREKDTKKVLSNKQICFR